VATCLNKSGNPCSQADLESKLKPM
jgi:hypothetical protein